MSEAEACLYVAPFAHIANVVKPVRAENSRAPLRNLWWQHWRPRAEMRAAIATLDRYIVTPEVSKHRLFVWLPVTVGADKNLIAIARDDDTSFGILHSRFHELWSLRLGSSLEDRPRYTPSTTFETFPFPDGLTPNLQAAAYAGDPRAQTIAAAARALVAARDRWLHPAELVRRVPEVVPGLPDRILPRDTAAAATLQRRTLTNLYNTRGTPAGTWLDTLHRTLDDAVAAAYGWPPALPDAEVLARLLALNQVRAGARRWLHDPLTQPPPSASAGGKSFQGDSVGSFSN